MDRHSTHLASPPPAPPCDLNELYFLGLLDQTEKAGFENHLQSGCRDCREGLAGHAETLAELATRYAVAPRPELRQQFHSRLRVARTKPRIKAPAVVLDNEGLLVVRPGNEDWRPGPVAGIWIKPLFEDGTRSYCTNLVRMEPGAHYPRHRHAAVEEAYMLEGDLRFDDQVLLAGDYCRAEKDSVHSDGVSQEGCTLIVMTSMHDEILA